MREIKFRAWENERMRHDFWQRCDLGNYLNGKGVFKDVIVMQYTGLKDKNGKEIYENDFFDCIYKKDGCKHMQLVVWNDKRAMFTLKPYGKCDQVNVKHTMTELERLEVIGNIYENKELLNIK